jgi:hypothetical protein
MPADLRDAIRELADLALQLSNYVPHFPAYGGPTMTERRIAEIRSLADQPEPPGVMTVAMALMLPQVRDGSHYAQTESDVFRVDGGFVEWRSRRGSLWASGAVNLAWFDAPCTLISSQGGAR